MCLPGYNVHLLLWFLIRVILMVLLLCYWLFFIYRPIYYSCDRSYHVSSSSLSSNFKPVTSSHPLTFSHLFELPFTFTGTTGGTVAILFIHQKLPKISFTKDFQIILWARERCSQTNKLHPSYVRTYGPDRDDCNNTNCLMYYTSETSDILGFLITGNIPSFDGNCRADLTANGGK